MKPVKLLFLAILMLLLPACTTEEPREVSTSVPPSIDPIEDSPYEEPTASPDDTADQIPVLLSTLDEDAGLIRVYHVFWDVSEGSFSDAEEWYTIAEDQILWAEKPSWWNGSPRVVTNQEPEQVKDGLTVSRRDYMSLGGDGSLEFVSNVADTADLAGEDGESPPYLQYTDADGTVTRLDYPDLTVPGDLTTEPVDTSAPFYAGQFDDTVLLVFMSYDATQMDGELYYVQYQTGDVGTAQWGKAYIPLAYAVDVYMEDSAPACDGATLYLSAWDEIVTVDLETGDLATLTAFDTFQQDHPNYCNEFGLSESPVLTEVPISIEGFWNGICVVRYDFYDKEGTEYLYYLAIQDDQVLGIMERDNGVFTFYDRELRELGCNSDYEGRLKNSGCNFAKQ